MTPPPVHDLRELEQLANAPGRYHGLLHLTQAEAVLNALPDLIAALKAAEPMARLPFPVSFSEHDQWREHQEHLRAALRPFYGRPTDE